MKVTLDLSAPCHHAFSKMPKALHNLWYGRGTADDLLSLIPAYGCPHTGGEHTFRFTADRADAVAWLDLFQEVNPEIEPEIMMIKRRIRLAVVQGAGVNSQGDLKIVLKEITKQIGHNGELIHRPWFWTPAWEEKEL